MKHWSQNQLLTDSDFSDKDVSLLTVTREQGTITLSNFEAGDLGVQSLTLEAPIGSYPENARLLKGREKSYIIAPIGHLIEERYTPYLQFEDSIGIA